MQAVVRETVNGGGRVIVFGDFFMHGDAGIRLGGPLAGELSELMQKSPALDRAVDGTTTHVLFGLPVVGTSAAGGSELVSEKEKR